MRRAIIRTGTGLALLCAAAALVWAQGAKEKPVVWSLSVTGTRQPVRPGQKFTARLIAEMAPRWHVYSITQAPGGPIATVISLPSGQPFRLAGNIRGPQPEVQMDPNFNMETETYAETATFTLPVSVTPKATTGKQKLTVDVLFQACNDRTCLPPATVSVQTVLSVAAANVASPPSSDSASPRVESAAPSASVTTASPVQPQKPAPGYAGSGAPRKSLAAFLWLAAAMGALSLLTPCVFPMIPITVSYFANHSGGSRRSAILTALIYAIGIILTFSALGMLLAVVFGAGGVNQLAANPWVNLLITAIFVGFAFSLFGAYFLQMPPGLMNHIDALTRSKEGSRILGALLMGFTFTLTSFTCTAPFVGTLLVMTAQGSWRGPLAGMLVFATVFAVPFFVLAVVPQLLSQLPKAGSWMNSVKVVMGFLEIAAAMKFLSNADLVWRWGIFTRQVVLATWVGLGVLIVLYVLGYIRMPHDTWVESVGAARLTIATVFLALTVWLVPGLFGRQLGELESFLPPEFGPGPSPASSSASLGKPQGEADWIVNDYPSALKRAQQEDKLIFIDFTGYTCTNCRWMETNMFPRPEVSREMEKFVRVRLYTDGAGEVFEVHQRMQQEKFGTVALPYYAILSPAGTPVATFPGLTRDVNEFVNFLQIPSKTQD